jgi:hypothetical protein
MTATTLLWLLILYLFIGIMYAVFQTPQRKVGDTKHYIVWQFYTYTVFWIVRVVYRRLRKSVKTIKKG